MMFSLHRNLIDHLNAEIGLGTITSVSSAKKWLSGTFLYVRLKDNPEHYKIDGDAPGRSIDERLEKTCSNSIAVLEEYDLVSATPKLRCTEFGDAMARYYLQFETMKVIMALPPHSKVSEILSAISQAAEFREVRFRAGEKPVYKDLNKNTSIKFPIPVNLDLPPHKVSLVIQSVLGAIDLPTEDHKHRVEYNSAKATIFQHATRLIRCIVDCQLYLEDAVTTRNALMLARSIGAQVWDDSPLHMKQLDGVGLVYVRKLATAGITSVEELENVEAHRIEQAVSRNPPFGSQVQTRAKAFPKLRISIKMVGEPDIKKGEHANIRLKADIGFLNETVPEVFQRRPIYVCLLAETSDGHKVHFARISAKKLSKGQDVLFSAILTDASQSVRAYVMCDEIAGTMRHAMLNPAISPSVFPPPKIDSNSKDQQAAATPANKGKRRSTTTTSKNAKDDESDEFADPDLDDADFARAEANGFINIDDFDDDNKGEPQRKRRKTDDHQTLDEDWEPQQLANGKWACNHRCGNKSTCKHMCCREGLDKKPKPPKAKDNKKDGNERGSDPKQTQLNIGVTKKTSASTQAQPSIEEHPSTKSKPTSAVKVKPRVSDSKEARDLDRLHNSVKTKTPNVPTLGSSRATDKAARTSGKTRQPRLSFLEAARAAEEDDGSDYGLNDEWSSNDLPDMNAIVGTQPTSRMSPPRTQAGLSGDGDDAFGAMDFDVEDEDPFQTAMGDHDNDQVDFSSFVNGLGIVGNDDTEIFDHSVHDAVDTQPAGPIGGVERHNTEPDRNNQHLFVGYSSEPPAKYASPSYVNTTQRRSIPAPLVKTTGSNDNAAAQLVHSVETSNQGAQEVAAPPQAAEKKEDDAYEWFYATFGKEHFNIVS
jgi:ATP-dependent DNA helicase HFM1/MER3